MDMRSEHFQLKRQARRGAPSQRRHAHNYYVLGRSRAEAGALEEAQRILLRALSFDAEYVPALWALANLELTRQHFSVARTYAERAITCNPMDAESFTLLGNIALSEQAPARALDAFQLAVQYGADAPEMRFNLGLAHLLLGHAKEAEETFLLLIDQVPLHPRAWDALGCARRLQRDYQGATNAFLQALQIDQQLNDARDHLAQLLLELGEGRRAEQVLRTALEMDPLRSTSRHLLGVALASVHDFPAAIICWTELISQQQASAETYHLLANAYMHINDPAHAREMLQALVTLFPRHLPGHLQLALLLMEAGEHAQGHRLMQEARALDPQNPAVTQALSAAQALWPKELASLLE